MSRGTSTRDAGEGRWPGRLAGVVLMLWGPRGRMVPVFALYGMRIGEGSERWSANATEVVSQTLVFNGRLA